VVDYNQLMQGRRSSLDEDDRRTTSRNNSYDTRDEFGRTKKESASMRNKYQSIFADGYRSDCEEFDYEIVNLKRQRRESGYVSDKDEYLKRKRGKYDIARSLLGDDSTDEEDDYDM